MAAMVLVPLRVPVPEAIEITTLDGVGGDDVVELVFDFDHDIGDGLTGHGIGGLGGDDQVSGDIGIDGEACGGWQRSGCHR